jgi:hypothetical protein
MENATTEQTFVFEIHRQERYSRVELILRSFLGNIYMVLPHLFLLFFVSIASGFLGFLAWWAVLFTGKYPRSFFNFQVDVLKWSTRLQARIFNLSDGYPAFGMKAEDEKIILHIAYPDYLSRGLLLLRLFFQFFYVLIPHGFCLFFRLIACAIAVFIAWWAVLITGEYPKGIHEFVVGTLRWTTRLNIYLSFLTDKYPPFSGKP